MASNGLLQGVRKAAITGCEMKKLSNKPISRKHIARLRADLLSWYDEQGRELPWRIRAGQGPADPYEIWLSEIMLQQTTIAHGAPYWHKFLTRFPKVDDLAAAPRDEVMAMWAGLGYYARARNLHDCAKIVAGEYDGAFPSSEKELLSLPGIGPYTAATMAAICFGQPANIVDSNVERVIARLFRVEAALPKAKAQIKALAAPLADPDRPGDYGQALMDLGALICTPKAPGCGACVWNWACQARKAGDPESYPKKLKKPRPVRYGAVFALMHDGQIWLERRADKGLLGGMLGLPGTDWLGESIDTPLEDAPVTASWQRRGQVTHVFTHFELRLDVYAARGSKRPDLPSGKWVSMDKDSLQALPSLYKKCLSLITAKPG